MKDRAGIRKTIESQLAVANETKSDFISLTVGEGKAILKLLEDAEAEIEGGGMTWFFVCGNCHTSLNEHANFCHECGRRIKWV